MSMRNDVRNEMISAALDRANERLRDGNRLGYFGRDTESGSARIIQYDAHGEVGMVAVGTPREMWQYLNGFNLALDIVGR